LIGFLKLTECELLFSSVFFIPKSLIISRDANHIFYYSQGVGVLAALEAAIRDFEDTEPRVRRSCFTEVARCLNGLFARFVEEQIRGIEETK